MSSLSDLRISVRRYIYEEDSTNSHFTDAEIDDYLNQATQFLGTQMEWPIQTDIATSVLDQALYSLPSDFVALIDGYFDNQKMTILERADLSALSSTWQNMPSSRPNVFYKAGQSTLGVYPPPDASNTGKEIQVQYVRLPATLTTDSDVPDLHSSFQICLPFYAAYLCEKKLGMTKTAMQNLQEYDLHRKALMSKVQRWSDDIFRFRWSGVY